MVYEERDESTTIARENRTYLARAACAFVD
jgi:hypothetical protein